MTSTMEPVLGVALVPESRRRGCDLCGAGPGVCLRCAWRPCTFGAHPLCAQRQQLLAVRACMRVLRCVGVGGDAMTPRPHALAPACALFIHARCVRATHD
jgi:hypothetical protein